MSETDLSLNEFIYDIRNFLDLLFEYRYGVKIDLKNGSLGKFFRAIKDEYIAKSYWLRYDIGHEHELLFELKNTSKYHYRPLAKLISNRFFLAKAIHSYSHDLLSPEVQTKIDINNKPLPFKWTLLCEWYNCEQRLLNSGFLGKANPVSKSKIYTTERQYCSTIEMVQSLYFRSQLTEQPPEKALEGVAALIAKHDRDFRENEYQPYLNRRKSCFRALRESKLYGMYLTEDGDMKILKQGVGGK